MALQKVTNQYLAGGVPGDFAYNSPRVVKSYIVSGGSVGCVYTMNTANPGQATLGGTGPIAGIAVNSKEYSITGLTPTLEFSNGANAQICSTGLIWVVSTTAVTVGMAAYYNQTDGTIQANTPSQSLEGWTEIPNAQFVYVNTTGANNIAILELR